MIRSGKASWVMVAGLAGVALVVGIFILGGDSPSSVAGKFMTALSLGNVDQLTELSYLPGEDKSKVSQQWDYAVNVSGKYYRFKFAIRSDRIISDTEAAVSISMWRNYFSGIAYDEKFELPMVKDHGKWLVDVRGINRELFPGLPR